MPKQAIKESRTLTVREAAGDKSGRLKVGLISPGWGSSGYYSTKVLENAADARVFPAGTHMFLDHETESEKYDRPERSVRDLAAVLTEDAVWDPDLGMLVGEAQVFGPYKDLLTDEEFAKAIGVSIRAYADFTVGEAEGRKGRIITELTEALSADFVTRAGRGGQVLEVLESARIRAQEATNNDTLEALQDALKDAYGGEKSWVWVRDFDESTVWFQHETPDSAATFAQAYNLNDDGTAELGGDRVEVKARTQYVPIDQPAAEAGTTHVPAPAGRTHPTQSSKEDTMGHIQVDEAEHGRLTEAAGRVPTLEAERDAARRERDEAREALAARDRRDAAADVIDTQAREAGVEFTALERRGLMAELPVTEAGTLDAEAFANTVKEAAAAKATTSGAGSVTGFGRTTSTTDTDTIAAAEKAAADAFGRQVKEA